MYRADQKNITYTQNFYDFADHSISLLRSKTPVDEDFAQTESRMSENILQRKLGKQFVRNKAGMVNVDRGVAKLEEDLFQSH